MIGSNAAPNSMPCPASVLFFRNSRLATRCFSTCITVDGFPFSGSLISRWMCSGMTTYPTTTKP